MLEKFKKFIKDNNLFNNNDRILLAVSGGVDSIVMTNLFARANFNFSIAHCNFKLRGKESDEDQLFVENLAKKYGAEFYTIDFQTTEYARLNKLSIQMAARELRYSWLEKIRCENNFKYIAIAHNADDSIETFFINLVRGTGIKGLTGISVKNKNIIRPLLFATRNEIMNYCIENNLKYREDSSNKEIKYLRNKIRHLIIPKFEQFNKYFKKNIIKTINYLDESLLFVDEVINNFKEKNVVKENDIIKIKIKPLLEFKASKFLLFKIISEYGFKNKKIDQIYSSLTANSGKVFYSKDYKLIKDREYIIIELIKEIQSSDYLIDINKKYIDKPINMIFEVREWDINSQIEKNPEIGYFDYEKIKLPLILRHWKPGDKFVPLGMKNFKKLSDFFIDNKFSINEKDKIWLLLSKNDIIWIVGYRIDDRYKITRNTRKALIIKLKK